MNLNQKLIEVRKSLPYLQKANEGYQFQYVAGVDILASIKTKMDELGILLYPVLDKPEHLLVEEVKKKKVGDKLVEEEAHSSIFKANGLWIFEDAESGKTKKIQWYFVGEQSDASWAFGSALTYSERYFLLKFFNIPTDELDPDKFAEAKPFLFNDLFAPSEDKRELSDDEKIWFDGAVKQLPNEKSKSTKEWIKLKHTAEAIAQTKKNINIIIDELTNT